MCSGPVVQEVQNGGCGGLLLLLLTGTRDSSTTYAFALLLETTRF